MTPRQLEVLRAIRTKMETSGYPPTIRELGDMLGIRSTNGVNDHLKTLANKGYIERKSSKSRALTITALGYESTAEFFPNSPNNPVDSALAAEAKAPVSVLSNLSSAHQVPLLGRIAAGQPIDAIEHVEEMLTVDTAVLGRAPAAECFALRVEGDSMIEDGILDGDIVFLRKQQTAHRGETVAVMYDGAATLKRYYREGDRIRLQPANSAMEAIIVDAHTGEDFAVLGRLVGLYRRYG